MGRAWDQSQQYQSGDHEHEAEWGAESGGVEEVVVREEPDGDWRSGGFDWAVVLLCSEAGKFITGTDIKIDDSLSCIGIGVWGLTLGVRRL